MKDQNSKFFLYYLYARKRVTMENLYQTLSSRGYLYQYTDEKNIVELLKKKEPFTFYMGIDPTAESLHIGHFFALMMFRYLQEAGHKGILVIGGATALVGDPTGKSDLRKILSYEEVQHNLNEVKKLITQFITVHGENPALILNNADWINNYSYTNFLRDVGTHFNINTMLNSDAYAKRLAVGGLTFLEMGYMLMQAYDFVYLNKNHNCVLQIGGSDQWGNIVAGVALHRKLENTERTRAIYGVTCPLLTTKDGAKMGKTESGTLWVAREKTTVFDFYQYFYNVGDENIEKLLKLFTKIPQDEIQNLLSTDIVKAKKNMAYEITKLVHGEDEAQKVTQSLHALYNHSDTIENMPSVVINSKTLQNGMDIVSFLVETNFIESKSEARRLITQGGIAINGSKVTDTKSTISLKDCINSAIIVRKGKKYFLKVTIR